MIDLALQMRIADRGNIVASWLILASLNFSYTMTKADDNGKFGTHGVYSCEFAHITRVPNKT